MRSKLRDDAPMSLELAPDQARRLEVVTIKRAADDLFLRYKHA